MLHSFTVVFGQVLSLFIMIAVGFGMYKAKRITDAVQSTLQLDGLDCASCKMKPICDEIDGLRELHFRKEGKR